MRKTIMVGCDLHDKTMLLRIAVDQGEAQTLTVANTSSGRKAMIAQLLQMAKSEGGARVVFAYEASGQGFGLYDELTDAGIEGYVLAPTRIAHSAQHKRRKTDLKDANRVLDLLRAHVLAGCELPAVWIPDPQTRDDRELVRARLDLSQKITRLKAQIKCLLKRCKVLKPESVTGRWTLVYRAWLLGLKSEPSPLAEGTRTALASLMRQLDSLEDEAKELERSLTRLVETARYLTAVQAMMRLKGVGVLTALVFLTEIGDLNRFHNRRQIGAFLGLVPSSHESGECSDRKGHITRQGPSRVRKVLCQAVWSRVRTDEKERIVYERIVAKNPKHKKIAVVASMRRLGICLWHRGLEGQKRGHELAADEAARRASADQRANAAPLQPQPAG